MIFNFEAFKKIRKEKRWSLGNLGKATGLSRRSLTNWENGHSEPKEQNIRKLASLLDIPVSMISDLQDTLPVSSQNINNSVSEFMSFYNEKNENRRYVDQIISGIKFIENKLNESSLVINAIISSINSPIYIKDVNQNYVLANNAFIELLGLTSNFKVSGKTDNDFFTSAEALKNLNEDQKVLDTGKEIINDEKYLTGSRKQKWGLVSKYPIYDSDNKIAGVFGIFIDITDKTRDENLRKLMETAFLNNSSTVLYIFNSKFKMLYLSDSFLNVFGYPKEKHLEDRDFWLNHCLHPDYREQFLKYRETNSWPKFLQYRGYNSNGQTKWLEASSYKFTYMNSECLAYIERDITSQKSLVWKNIAMFEIINKIPNTIVWSGTINDNGKLDFDFITSNAEAVTGFNQDDIVSGKIELYSFLEEKTKAIFEEWLNSESENITVEHYITLKNGNKILINTHIFSIINQNDRKTYFGMHSLK